MSDLTKDSTISQIYDAYLDNMSYFEDSSVAKALIFVTACKGILALRPQRVRHGEEEVELSLKSIEKQHDDAQGFVSAKGTDGEGGGFTTQVDLRGFRD